MSRKSSGFRFAIRKALTGSMVGICMAATASAQPQEIRFERVSLPETDGVQCTSVAIGPDGWLYGTVKDGLILRWPLLSDGTTGQAESLDSLQLAEGGQRLLIGIAFDPAASAGDLIAWVSHTTYGFEGMPAWGSKITRLSGPTLAQVQDYVVDLPRSVRDHATNGIDFGPDGALYFTQASNSAMGAPDSKWAFRPERVLTAAVLRLDASAIPTPPLNVRTAEGGSYDPYAPGAALTIYASGVRNAYDLVWHTNGELYAPANGSRVGGSTPGASPGAPCANGSQYSGPEVPGLTHVRTQTDYLYRVEPGGYYGHSNPLRCEFVMNGGNPTAGPDLAEVEDYPVGTLADPNYRGFSFDFGDHRSPNGIIEYRASHFGGALQGKLLVLRFNKPDDIIVLTPGGPDNDIVAFETGIEGFTGFKGPLDLVEDPTTGFLYVTEYERARIQLLRPRSIFATNE